MKKIVILALMGIFVFASGNYAEAVTTLTTATAPGTGAVEIAIGTFAKQDTAVVSFTTSVNSYVGFTVSASEENYTVISGHKMGDSSYGMDSTGGPTYKKARAGSAGAVPSDVAPAASATGADNSATWTAGGWTAQ